MTKDERKEQKRKEAFRKWARQHAKLRRNLRKHGGDILQSGNFKSSTTTSSMTGMTSIPTKSCTAFTIRMLRWKMRVGSIS